MTPRLLFRDAPPDSYRRWLAPGFTVIRTTTYALVHNATGTQTSVEPDEQLEVYLR